MSRQHSDNPGPSRQSIIDRRRLLVERLVIRGHTHREIHRALANKGHVNPNDGKPWSLGTISTDINYIEKAWRDEAVKERREYKSRQLAALRELQRAAWQAGELAEVRQSIMAEVALMGTKAVDISLDLDLSNLSDEQLQRIAQGEDPIHVLATTG